jgi:flagellar hook-basal body complex protein FliE
MVTQAGLWRCRTSVIERRDFRQPGADRSRVADLPIVNHKPLERRKCNGRRIESLKSAAINQAMQAYTEAARQIEKGASGSGSSQAVSGFDALLRQELETTIDDLRHSEDVGIQAAAGTADLQTVVEALTKAELSLQKVTAVRDRVIAAYEEIMRMPI